MVTTTTADETAAALAAALAPLLARRWLFLGVGNDLRGDDAFGPRLARRLAARHLPAIDAGTAPENETGTIRRIAPEVVLLADAVEMGEAPGTVKLLPPRSLLPDGPSTHDPGLALLATYLERELGIEVRVLACQPAVRAFGSPPTPAVLAAVDALAARFA